MTAADDMPALRPFTGVTLDRAGLERKDPEWVSAQLARPDTRALAGGREGVLVTDGAEPAGMLRVEVDARQLDEVVLLGLEHGRALLALDLDG